MTTPTELITRPRIDRSAAARTPVSSRPTSDAGTRVGCSFCVASSFLEVQDTVRTRVHPR